MTLSFAISCGFSTALKKGLLCQRGLSAGIMARILMTGRMHHRFEYIHLFLVVFEFPIFASIFILLGSQQKPGSLRCNLQKEAE